MHAAVTIAVVSEAPWSRSLVHRVPDSRGRGGGVADFLCGSRIPSDGAEPTPRSLLAGSEEDERQEPARRILRGSSLKSE